MWMAAMREKSAGIQPMDWHQTAESLDTSSLKEHPEATITPQQTAQTTGMEQFTSKKISERMNS